MHIRLRVVHKTTFAAFLDFAYATVLPRLSRIHADTNCPLADCVSSWTMVLIGMGVSYVLGQGSLFSSLSPFPPPAPPLYPPAHPSILFQPFGQLSLNPANHRLGWSVGNQTSPWLCSCPTHNDSRDYLTKRLQHVGMRASLAFR